LNADSNSKQGGKGRTFEDLTTPTAFEGKIKVGVCCMRKKLKSKPMQAILTLLSTQFNELNIIEFEEEMIINAPIEVWPEVEVFICFYSSGFPIDKTLEYVRKHKPV
jgi:inositol hexakisphosphate/diphosphoinositol-pentakisphosphate kinase